MTNRKVLCTTTQFQQLLSLIQKDGYKLLGPTVRSDAIIYGELQSAQDLPVGWMDEQDAGYYRLKRRADEAYFGYNLSQHSWKQFLFPPKEKLYSFEKQHHLTVSRGIDPFIEKMAFIGVRACEIQAILVQDKVFGDARDAYEQYRQRRESIFIMAVQCTRSVSTCFCASMGSGPETRQGFDLSLIEIIDATGHYFIIEIGSSKGLALCEQLSLPDADEKRCQKAASLVEKNRCELKRHVDNGHVHEMLMKSWNGKRWDHVAARCVNCANCTMVCPTCFCSETIDASTIDGAHCNRWQRWDSCFTLSHSYVHGGSVRPSDRSRYRQWLTHKFGTWWDQFGMSGCVGCGRCITWCPVGIDVTEELKELQKETGK
jgi:ferredoxin